MLILVVLSSSLSGRPRAKTPKIMMVLLLTMMLVALSAPAAILGQGHIARAETRVFSASELMSMPSFSGHYTFLKSQPPYTYYEADYAGVPLSYLLEQELKLAPGAASVVIKATDGYEKTISLSQARMTYPEGLKVILAHSRDGSQLGGDEGPFRLIVPQEVPGNMEEGGVPNTPLCVKMVYAIGVTPVPADEAIPSMGSVPSGSVAFYGAVTSGDVSLAPEPAPTTPTEEPQVVAPEPEPQEEPLEEQPLVASVMMDAEILSVIMEPNAYAFLAIGSSIGLWVNPLGSLVPLLYYMGLR